MRRTESTSQADPTTGGKDEIQTSFVALHHNNKVVEDMIMMM